MTVQIVISNDFGPETTPTHGLVDVAAALASDAWDHTQAGEAVAELHSVIQTRIPPELSEGVADVTYAYEAALRYGARLGYALASTCIGAEKGWAAWLAAAEEWLGQTNCSAAEHHDSLIEECAKEIKKLSK